MEEEHRGVVVRHHGGLEGGRRQHRGGDGPPRNGEPPRRGRQEAEEAPSDCRAGQAPASHQRWIGVDRRPGGVHLVSGAGRHDGVRRRHVRQGEPRTGRAGLWPAAPQACGTRPRPGASIYTFHLKRWRYIYLDIIYAAGLTRCTPGSRRPAGGPARRPAPSACSASPPGLYPPSSAGRAFMLSDKVIYQRDTSSQ